MDHGMRLEHAAGRLVRVVDRDGAVHAELAWRGNVAHAAVRLDPDSSDELVVEPAHADPVFGRAHPIALVRGTRIERLTTCTPITWAAPREIPAIAAPGALPPGSGSALLNLLAIAAADAGVAALRYAGPYPTAALWRSLVQSFRTTGTEAAFTADAAGRALRLTRDPIEIDFAPAPFARAWIPGGEVHLRDGVERARFAGVTYARGASVARLVRAEGGWAAEVWFGDAPWARTAVITDDGRMIDGPHPVTACTSAVIGQAFPAALREALGDLIAGMVATPLVDAARGVLAETEVRWADCGAVAARGTSGGLEVHAALWERIAPLGLPRLAAALAEALAPVVAARAQRRLATALA